jgi:hypothetical protein
MDMAWFLLFFLTFLQTSPSWSKECDPSFYAALVGRVDDIVKLESLANKQRKKDPAFQKAALTAVERALNQTKFSAGYVQQRAADLLLWLSEIPANQGKIEKLYTNFEKKILTNNQVLETSHDFFERFISIPYLRERAENLMRTVLKASGSNRQFQGDDAFFTRHFKSIKDPKLRADVTEHMLSYLEKSKADRNPLYNFSRVNPRVKELKEIPVALGVHSNLSKMSRLKRAAIYREWSLLGWVSDGETIGTFRAPFHKVMKQSPKIHFEIGALLKDIDGLKESTAKIKKMGDREALRKIKTAYLNHSNPETMPKFRDGELSITNLELYWILTNPDFLAKTTFYDQYKEVSPEKIKTLIKALNLKEIK